MTLRDAWSCDDVAGAIVPAQQTALQKDPYTCSPLIADGQGTAQKRRSVDPRGRNRSIRDTALEARCRPDGDWLCPWPKAPMPVRAESGCCSKADCPCGAAKRQSQVDLLILRQPRKRTWAKAADAVRSLVEARALDPVSRSPCGWRFGTNVLLRTGDKTRATRLLLTTTIKLAPRIRAVWNLRASRSPPRRQFAAAALADYGKASALDSRNVDALVAQARNALLESRAVGGGPVRR